MSLDLISLHLSEHLNSCALQQNPRVVPRVRAKGIVRHFEAGRPLCPVGPYDAMGELCEEARGVTGDDPIDLAQLPAVRYPTHIYVLADETRIERGRLCTNREAFGHRPIDFFALLSLLFAVLSAACLAVRAVMILSHILEDKVGLPSWLTRALATMQALLSEERVKKSEVKGQP